MAESKQAVWLVYGSTGWIGGLLVKYLTKQGKTVVCGKARLENVHDVATELDQVKPAYVMNAAGLTGRPNVDWCEDHKQEVVAVNVIGTLALADACEKRGIHMTNFGTGCIYSYDAEHALGSGKGFTESDAANFSGSFYSLTKGMVQKLIENYSKTLTLRVRMPISDDLNHRNFITKISKYERVVNIPNSITVLKELLPVSVIMAERGLTGTYNFTNPGVVSHNEILDLYKQYVDPTFTYRNFTEEEQSKILKAGRSNNELDQSKLLKALPDVPIPHIKESIVGVFQRMKENLANNRAMEL